MNSVIKAAVFSDTHSNTAPMLDAVRRSRPDLIIHLGDHDRDTADLRREFPDIPLYNVRGNCDLFALAPDTDIVPLGPVKAFITHGHLYSVDFGRIDSLAYAAEENGCKIAMYGHTHRALHEQLGGVTVINPGTAGKGSTLTWALVEVFENGGIACDILPLSPVSP